VEFTYRQREATKRAGEIAGFKQVRLVEEPIAAAMAYGLDVTPESRYIMVYDLGGGTLDVAILHLEDGAYRVVGTSGDPHLGGADFDDGVVQLLLEKLSKLTEKNATQDKQAMQALWTTAELTKIELSKQTQVPESQVQVKLPYGLQTTVSLGEYDTKNKVLYERAMEPIRKVLDGHGFKPDEIHELVLVGGSTRMPQIQKMILTHFKREKLHNSIDPDEAIAIGAAAGFGCGHKG